MGATTNDAAAVTLLVWQWPDMPGSGDAAASSDHLDLLLELPLALFAAARVADDAAPVQLMVDSRRASVLLLRTVQGCIAPNEWLHEPHHLKSCRAWLCLYSRYNMQVGHCFPRWCLRLRWPVRA